MRAGESRYWRKDGIWILSEAVRDIRYRLRRRKMVGLTSELRKILCDAGAGLTGCADLSLITAGGFQCGVAVAVPIPADVVRGIMEGPTNAYFHAFHEVQRRLDEIVMQGEDFLTARGFRAYAQTSGRIEEDAAWRTALPHKTVATNAGLGWIGKSCLLVTREYGSAVRLSSLLTDAPLICGEPVRESRCRGCKRCVEACPAHALSGASWDVRVDRDAMLDRGACRDKQLELTRENTDFAPDFLCGRCFAVCPFTKRYLTGKE